MSDEDIEEKEQQAIEKALIEAKSNMKQPIVLRADEQTKRKKKLVQIRHLEFLHLLLSTIERLDFLKVVQTR